MALSALRGNPRSDYSSSLSRNRGRAGSLLDSTSISVFLGHRAAMMCACTQGFLQTSCGAAASEAGVQRPTRGNSARMGFCSTTCRNGIVNIILFYAGLGKRGGISPDIRHLETALREEGVPLTVACRFKDALLSKGGRDTIVNVYGCLPSIRNISVMLMARIKGQRLVWTPVFHPRRGSTWKHSGWYRVMTLFDRAAPHLARLTHAVSVATEEEASFFYTMGAPRVEIIPLVVEATYHRLEGADRDKARDRLGVGNEPLALLVAAHSPRRKGMDFASAVLTELRLKLPSATFLVLGGGDLGALAGQPGVKALGWCPDRSPTSRLPVR